MGKVTTLTYKPNESRVYYRGMWIYKRISVGSFLVAGYYDQDDTIDISITRSVTAHRTESWESMPNRFWIMGTRPDWHSIEYSTRDVVSKTLPKGFLPSEEMEPAF